MDPLLQAAHTNVPWILTWDDHEVANNWADETPEVPQQGIPERRAAPAPAATAAESRSLRDILCLVGVIPGGIDQQDIDVFGFCRLQPPRPKKSFCWPCLNGIVATWVKLLECLTPSRTGLEETIWWPSGCVFS